MQLSEIFKQALQDYILLLNKKYPEKAIHELVSTRYALNHFERSMLYRGITTHEKAEKRKGRLITVEQLDNRTLHIDLFNVLFTIAAYLRGFPVYVASDGFVRDASEGHDSHEWVSHLEKALDLLLKHLDEIAVGEAVLYLDNPLHMSGYFSAEIENKAGSMRARITILRDESPDHLIVKSSDGVVCTSDSMIIDRSSSAVFDLPRHILERAFKPELLALDRLINPL
jgi:hypothetical protein